MATTAARGSPARPGACNVSAHGSSPRLPDSSPSESMSTPKVASSAEPTSPTSATGPSVVAGDMEPKQTSEQVAEPEPSSKPNPEPKKKGKKKRKSAAAHQPTTEADLGDPEAKQESADVQIEGVQVEKVQVEEGLNDVPAQELAESSDAKPVPTKPSKKSSISEMRTALAALGLDTHGKRETLYNRLNVAFNRAKQAAERAAAAAAPPKPHKQPFKSFLCFDVEATCEEGTNFDYPNEIIEFPVVLMRWEGDDTDEEGEPPAAPRRLVRVDTFHSYVRPTWRPQLSAFCTSLTGIQQATIDAAPTFPEMLTRFEAWLESHELLDGDRLHNAMWVTDGAWDLRDFIPKQLHITPLSPARYPAYFTGRYLNIKSAVRSVTSEENRREKLGDSVVGHQPRITTGIKAPRVIPDRSVDMTITGQLALFGLGGFEGRQHSGIDDASNIARVLGAIAERGVLVVPNAGLPSGRNSKRWDWMGAPGEVVWRAKLRGEVAQKAEEVEAGEGEGEGGLEEKLGELAIQPSSIEA